MFFLRLLGLTCQHVTAERGLTTSTTVPLPFLNTAGCHLRSWEVSVLLPALHQRPVGWQSKEKGKEKMAAGPFQPDKHPFDILPSRRQFWCISAAPPATITVSSQRQSPSSICPSQSADPSTSHTKAYSHNYTHIVWPSWLAQVKDERFTFTRSFILYAFTYLLLFISPVQLYYAKAVTKLAFKILTGNCLCSGSKSEFLYNGQGHFQGLSFNNEWTIARYQKSFAAMVEKEAFTSSLDVLCACVTPWAESQNSPQKPTWSQ